MVLIDQMPRSADACAGKEVITYELMVDELTNLLCAQPVIGQAILLSICRQFSFRLHRLAQIEDE
jgi:CRP-like cAMP-binding protein